MEMEDELEQFIQERRARVAEDKANLAKGDKSYDPAIKENIPPFKRSTVQGKDESCCLSLPTLGEDYERRKQMLQQDLRLDYRRYMAQKKHLDTGEPFLSLPLDESRTAKEHLASLRAHQDLPDVLLHSPRPPLHPDLAPSRRDAATLTEGRRGARRARGLGEPRGLWPEDDPLPPQPHRGRTRLVRVELDSEEGEEDSEEELELVERRRPRQTGLEPALPERRRQRHYKTDCNRDLSRLRDRRVELSDDYIDPTLYGQRLNNNNNRERKDDGSVVREEECLEARRGTSSQTPKLPKLQVTAGTRVGGRSRSSTSKKEAEFATGLMIGSAVSDAALRRGKERYRLELQEQMAEKQRSRRREKELELRAAATAVPAPERQPKSLGPVSGGGGGGNPDHTRLRRDIPYRPGQSLELPGEDVNRRPTGDRDREKDRDRLPPVQPRVPFQSPLLEYSAALGLGSAGMSPYSQAFPRSMDPPRHPWLLPHPPSTTADAHRTPYDDAYLYYGARNPPLDPNLPYYGHVPFPGGVQQQPMSYLALPPGGPPPSQTSPHSLGYLSEHRPASDAANMISGMGAAFPGEKTRPPKESALTYKEALKQQIQERQERRRLEREESDRYEAKLEADMKAHDPWGRGGGGAPLRDSRGNLVTDLHQMHKNNEEAYTNPDTWQKRASTTMVVPREEERPPSTHRVSGYAHVATPQFARGSVFTDQPTPQQLHEQDKYKTYLKQQIEEKRLKEAQERERVKQEEEKEERRLAEQRARIQREYEEEQDRKKRKEREQNAKNEELIRLAEERRKEVERKKKEAEEKENDAMRKEYERERQARVEEAPRQASPPIPTHQRHAPQYHPRPPSLDSRRSTAPLSERSLSGLQSPPVPARRNQLRAAEDQRGVISELSALRRQLRSEQKRVEGQLLQADWDDLDSLGDRHSSRECPPVDVFDLARLRLQAPVRRPSSRNTKQPSDLHRLHDPLQIRYTDHDSREGHGYPSPPRDRQLDIVRQADYREQQRRASSQRRKPADDYFDLLPPQQHNHYLRSGGGDPMSRGSLLESESAFIDPMGDAFPVPPSPEERTPHPQQLSARERRRLAKRNDTRNERGFSREAIGQQDNYSLQSEGSVSVEVGRERNGGRTRRLLGLSRHGRRTGDLSDDDEDEEDVSPQVSPRGPGRGHSSVETVATEPWLRPDTSETLKRLMTSQTPRERDQDRLASGGTGVQDWDGPSTYHG